MISRETTHTPKNLRYKKNNCSLNRQKSKHIRTLEKLVKSKLNLTTYTQRGNSDTQIQHDKGNPKP